jgi:hypothetical protein
LDLPVLSGKRSGAGGVIRGWSEVERMALVSLVGRGHRLREKFGGGNPCSWCLAVGMECVSSELFLLVFFLSLILWLDPWGNSSLYCHLNKLKCGWFNLA